MLTAGGEQVKRVFATRLSSTQETKCALSNKIRVAAARIGTIEQEVSTHVPRLPDHALFPGAHPSAIEPWQALCSCVPGCVYLDVWFELNAAACIGTIEQEVHLFIFTLVTCPKRYLSLQLSGTRVYEPRNYCTFL